MRISSKSKSSSSSSSSRVRKDSSPSSIMSTSTTTNTTNSTSSTTTTSNSSSISLLREDLRAEDEFEMIRVLNEGSFSNSKVLLASVKSDADKSKVVIKSKTSLSTSADDFNREVELTYLLSPHPNIVTCYNVTFLWSGSYCFLQEYAGYGSLLKVLQRRRSGTLGEQKGKLVCSQIALALEFMHHLHLVHGQVTPDNVLVFRGNLSQVKLSDFSGSRTEGSLVMVKPPALKDNSSRFGFFKPPELSELLPLEKFHMTKEQDVWQLGVMAYYLLEGRGPWGQAEMLGDPGYRQYYAWVKRKCTKTPERLRGFTPRFLRMFKRLCDPKAGQRSSIREVQKYLKDPWILRNPKPHKKSPDPLPPTGTPIITTINLHHRPRKSSSEESSSRITRRRDSSLSPRPSVELKIADKNQQLVMQNKIEELEEWVKNVMVLNSSSSEIIHNHP